MKGVFVKTSATMARAVGQQAIEALGAVKLGAQFVADVRPARNPEQLELFWTLCTIVADAEDSDKEHVKKWLLHKLGYVDIWFDPDGSMHIETQSIAFESMEQAKFSRFMDAAIPLMAERVGAAPADLRRRFEELLDPEARANWRRYGRHKSPPTSPMDTEIGPPVEPEQVVRA